MTYHFTTIMNRTDKNALGVFPRSLLWVADMNYAASC